MNKYAKPLIVGFIVLFAVSFVLGMLGGAVGADLGALPVLAGLFTGGFTAYIMANLAGNRAGVAASDADRAQAASLIPLPGKGLLIVYREGFVAMAAGMNLALDGREFAQLKGGKFTAIAVGPGEHQLSAGFGGLAGPQNNAATVSFFVAAGQAQVYRATVSMGAIKNTIALETAPGDRSDLSARLARMPMTAPDVQA
ncbi:MULTISPECIES: hypothetical protein [unclassified Brevundimonas]|uniref:hypothetical protein n=1 Tax=unclassified Brevundimonas TaxID=2622653 RepID=UPI000CFBDB8F|nr:MULTISPECIES: hypothetical protein [unclassified Brevundimonas]PRA32013.1 hypothetical protein CQ024_06120 [Brevundimonas sp. MYb27]PQZ82753.1 hypothetical protein CQ026_08345 [Brevundimonas sp. MYb31]PRB16961.1 hypothetical protein CQ039_04785 [Brevundimonas sp. MYb52]PRB37324.1 hypothetical protein CQ035_03210 [Brevundimonas sp. MYb46]PRB54828.1 hypothetical protein CQ028_03335 [Brevundimonas sp. MYb33]